MPTARLTKFDDLLAYLRENNVPHKADPAGLSVELPLATPANAGSVYVRWEKDLPYVQVIYPFVGEVPDARVPDVESAIVRVNNTIKLPGFGYEHGNHIIYMRLCVQLYDEGISATSFQRQVFAVLQNANEFVGAFRDVVAGASGKDVLDLAVKHNTPASA